MPQVFRMSAAHMQAFSEQQRQRFEDELVAYLWQCYPRESAALGDDGLRALVTNGIEKARGYDIVLERDVARYIEFMIALSPDFDECKNTPWAKGILTERRSTAQAKLDRLAEYHIFSDPQLNPTGKSQ